MKNRNTIEVLRHSRHDWLNKIQLIKANLALQRYERIEDLISEIVMEAHHEASLSNLHAPQFVEYILTFAWEPKLFSIEYEILNNPKNLSKHDDKLFKAFQSLFETIENSADKRAENKLFFSIECEEGFVRFFFDLSGIILENNNVKMWFDSENCIFTNVNQIGTDLEYTVECELTLT